MSGPPEWKAYTTPDELATINRIDDEIKELRRLKKPIAARCNIRLWRAKTKQAEMEKPILNE